MHGYWLLLLPIAAMFGWFAAISSMKHSTQNFKSQSSFLSRDYLTGLNFLLNEEPDKALDIFIKMLDVDSDTVETHLALGNLFRRRGEVNRAIRIHQNLIARPNLDRETRSQALVALAGDYLSAGVLDRAERLYLELVDLDEQTSQSLHCLLDIYQREKEWQKAIDIAHQLSAESRSSMSVAIAHYYCELAEISAKNSSFDQAIRYLNRALSTDKNCARASLLFADFESNQGNYKKAIRYLKQVREQNVDFFSEAILPIVDNYRQLGKEMELVSYFKNILQEFPRMPVAIFLSEQIREWRGDKVAATFVADYVRKHPSIRGLHRLLELHLSLKEGSNAYEDLRVIHVLMEKLLSEQPLYRCNNCGFAGNTLHWLCPSCKKWSTIKSTYVFDES